MMGEREFSTDQARQRLVALYQKLHLHPVLTEISDGWVAICHAFNETGEEVSSGAGKGEHCTLGAMAECLEHFSISTSTPTLISSQAIREAVRPYNDGLLHALAGESQVPALQLKAIGSRETLWIPAILLAPCDSNLAAIENTPVAFLARYASNSGTALGCSEKEALLHALNEVIERHALSIYYMALCGLAPSPTLYRPAESWLAEVFGHDSTLLQQAMQMEIYVNQSDFGTWFCIAMPAKPTGTRLTPVGSGSSVLPSIALYRAVTEQIQCETLHGPDEVQEDANTVALLEQSPRLAKLRHPRWPHERPNLHPVSRQQCVTTQIAFVLKALRQQGKPAFSHTLQTYPDLATIVQVFVPGLERFHLIRSGIPVVPQYVLHAHTGH
nr:YcaO-like family protein [uncultured Pseudomonas sp.]